MLLKKVRREMLHPFRQRCHSPIPDQHEIQCPETLIKAPSGTVEARTEALTRDVGDRGMGGVRLMEGDVMPIQYQWGNLYILTTRKSARHLLSVLSKISL